MTSLCFSDPGNEEEWGKSLLIVFITRNSFIVTLLVWLRWSRCILPPLVPGPSPGLAVGTVQLPELDLFHQRLKRGRVVSWNMASL